MKSYKATTSLSINIVLPIGANKHIAFSLPAQPASAVTAQPASTASTPPSQLTTVNVTDLDDAKDYLADKFGMSRTKLRSRDSIESAAKQVGIKFNYE